MSLKNHLDNRWALFHKFERRENSSMPDTLLQCIGLGFGAILHHTLCNIINNHAREDLALLSW
jgi:hypothetical protein